MTVAAGLPAYEISNHARPGEESRHNLTYWRYLDYHGIGPGAHGRRGGIATLRHKKPENFLAAISAQDDGIAEHRVLGLNHRFDAGIDLQAEIYQKRYRGLRPRFENALDTYEFAAESNFDRIRVEPESAEARGVELTLRNRDAGRLNWWLSYTWSEAEDVIDGVTVPRSWDQRHALTGNLSWQGDKWLISVVGRYRSGWPRTPLLLTSLVDKGGTIVGIDVDLSQRNATSYDDYFRVDVRFSRTVPLDRGSLEYYFEVFNVFNTDNQCCVPDHDLSLDPVISAQPNIDDFLPFFPSFGVKWTFGRGAR